MNAYAPLPEQLYKDGARKFLFINVPAFTRSPLVSGGSYSQADIERHAAMVSAYNTALNETVTQFSQKHTDVRWDNPYSRLSGRLISSTLADLLILGDRRSLRLLDIYDECLEQSNCIWVS